MKKLSIPKLNFNLNHKHRGRSSVLKFDKQPYDEGDYNQVNNNILNEYEKYIKIHQLDKSVMFQFPTRYKRLTERQLPCVARRHRKEDESRKRDRAFVKDFCNWFMWLRSGPRPETKPKRKL